MKKLVTDPHWQLFLSILEDLSKKSGKPLGLQQIVDYLDVEEGTFKGWFRGNAEIRLREDILKLLYLGFNFPVDKFGMDTTKIFTDFSPELSSYEEFLLLKHLIKENGAEDAFENQYYGALQGCIGEASEKIYVYDYLDKVDRISNEHYEKAHKEYFELIEARIIDSQNKNFKYYRLLILPFPRSREHKEELIGESFLEAIRMCSLSTFKHISRCLLKHENNSGFFVIRIPSRLYSYSIIDNNYVITEHYRYDKEGRAAPDLLLIQGMPKRYKPKLTELFEMYEREIERLIKPIRERQLTQFDFIEVTKELKQKFEENIKLKSENSEGHTYAKRREEIKELEKQLDSINEKYDFMCELFGI